MRTVTLELPDDVAERLERLGPSGVERLLADAKAAALIRFDGAMDRLRETSSPTTDEDDQTFLESLYERSA